jgi:hypothetical protein
VSLIIPGVIMDLHCVPNRQNANSKSMREEGNEQEILTKAIRDRGDATI